MVRVISQHGGRRREYLSWREEKQLVYNMRKRIRYGSVKDVKTLEEMAKRKVWAKRGKEISDSYIYRFLERHGIELNSIRFLESRRRGN